MIPRPERDPGPRDLGAISYSDNFFPDKVQPDDLRRLTIVKMTMNRIAHIRVQFSQAIGLGHNGLTQRSGHVATLGRVFDHKYDFIHFIILTHADGRGQT